MRIAIIPGSTPQSIVDLRAHGGYGLTVQVSKGQTASGIRIDTDPTTLLQGGGITLDPALAAGTSGGSFTFPQFSDRLFAVVDTGVTNISIDVIKWKVKQDFDLRKQPIQSGYESNADLTGVGVPQAR